MDDRIKNQETASHRGGPENNTITIASPSPYVENTVAKLPNFVRRFQPRVIGVTPIILDSPMPKTTNRVITTQDRQHFNPQSNINSQNLNFQHMQSQAEVRLPNAPYFQSLHQQKSFVTLVDTLTKSNQCSQRAKTNSSGTSFPFQRQLKD